MSKLYCNIKFDNEDLREEFVKLIPNISTDIQAFLKSGLEMKGISSEPEIVVDSEKEVIKINLISNDKGPIILLDENEVKIADYKHIEDGALYASLNTRTKLLEIYVKGDGVDRVLGGFQNLKGLIEGWKSVEIPQPILLEEVNEAVADAGPETVMEVVKTEETADE